ARAGGGTHVHPLHPPARGNPRSGDALLDSAPAAAEPPQGGSHMKKLISTLTLALGVTLLGAACEVPAEEAPPVQGGESSSKAEGRSEEHTSELQSRENLVCR